MSHETIWIVILGGMVVTYSLRSSFLVFLGRESIPLWLFRSLRFTPAVALAALISQMVVTKGGAIQISLNNPQIITSLIALAIALRTKNTIVTLLAGMGLLWVLGNVIN